MDRSKLTLAAQILALLRSDSFGSGKYAINCGDFKNVLSGFICYLNSVVYHKIKLLRRN